VWYRAAVIDRGGDGPVFRVSEKGHPEVAFEGGTPSTPWIALCRAIREGTAAGKGPLSASGPENFGLAHPQVREWIAQLENAEKCRNFQTVERSAALDGSDSEYERTEKVPAEKRRSTVVDFGKLLLSARRPRSAVQDFVDGAIA
jgi:hypothetical protein